MSEFYLKVGDTVTFSKTVSESDVYLFAGITGDLSGNHVNAQYMKRSAYGQRVAHGALMIGFMSTTSTKIIDKCVSQGIDETPVSLGYDRVRFLRAVFFGDTVTVTYTITEVDTVKRQTNSKIEVRNQNDELVAVAAHILRWVRDPQPAVLPAKGETA